MSEVLDVFVQARSFVERQDERRWGACGTPKAKLLMPDCQEKLLRESRDRSYRNPTQVDSHKYGKALERTLLKELGKMTP